jgi:hypothetical protein
MRSFNRLSRRDLLRLSTFASLGISSSGWLKSLARAAEESGNGKPKRSCILLWMSGGPTQTDTFDPKPEHENGGEFSTIQTSVPGIQIGEHLPELAKRAGNLSIIRSMATKEGDHSRATYLMRTGYLPQGPILYPTLGSVLSRELGTEGGELPNFVSVAPNRFVNPRAFGPGFLGPAYAPLVVGEGGVPGGGPDGEANVAASLQVRNLSEREGLADGQTSARLDLLTALEDDFQAARPDVTVTSHRKAYEQAVRMMRGSAAKAFDLAGESDELRAKYGNTQFGQGCLLARRLVERGVPFVEVTLNAVPDQNVFGWDTHQNNFESVKSLCGVLDPAWSTLIDDLKDRGLLETTTIVWMGEFGRTPKINENNGRDHFPAAWSTVLCGGGIRGGQVIGSSSPDGMTVADRPVNTPNLIATVCKAVGLDPETQNMSNIGRPIPLADHRAEAIEEALAG